VSGQPRVLLVSAEYPPQPGGIGDYTALLASHLADAGCTVAVLTSGTGNVRCDSAVAIYPAVPRWTWGFSRIVREVVEETRPEILHLQYQTGMYAMHPAINILPGPIPFAKGPDHLYRYLPVSDPSLKPWFVTTFHDVLHPYLFPKAGPLRAYATRYLARESDAVVATNGADLVPLKGWNLNAISIPIGSNIPAAVHVDRVGVRARYGIERGEVLLTTFGLMNHSKGIGTVIEALASLRAGGVNAHLLLVGAGAGANDPTNAATERQLTALCAARGVTPFVTRTGALPPGDVAAVLAASDVCLQPYRDGASPRRGSLLAALTQGIPVVTTIPAAGVYDGLPEPRDDETVCFVPPDDPAALAAAACRILTDGSLAARLRAGARAYAAHFAWPSIARQHLALYASLAASAPRREPIAVAAPEGEH
jgi:glycosyltransferase involved in cell wall biosynthesis